MSIVRRWVLLAVVFAAGFLVTAVGRPWLDHLRFHDPPPWVLTQSREFGDGHTEPVGWLAFHPNSKRLASVGSDRTVRLWDLEGKRELASQSRKSGFYFARLAFSSDGERLAVEELDSGLCFFDAGLSKRQANWKLKTRGSSLAYSPDGKILAVAEGHQQDRKRSQVELRSAPTGEVIRTLESGTTGFKEVCWDRAGKLVAVGAVDGPSILVWEVDTGRRVGAFGECSQPAISPDGAWLAGEKSHGEGKEKILVWNVQTGQLHHALGEPGIATFLPDGKLLLTGPATQTPGGKVVAPLTLWDVARREVLERSAIPLSPAPPLGLGYGRPARVLSPDGKLLALSDHDPLIRIWDVERKQLTAVLGRTAPIGCLALSPKGDILVSASGTVGPGRKPDRPTTVLVWETASGKLRSTWHEHAQAVHLLAFSLEGDSVLSGGRDGEVRRRSLTDDRTEQLAKGGDGVLTALAGDGSAAVLGPDNELRLGGRKLLPQGAREGVVLSADGSRLACPCADGIRAIDLATGQVVARLPLVEPVTALALSTDGKLLAAGTAKGVVQVWAVDTGDELNAFPSHRTDAAAVRSLAFTRDGKILAGGHGKGWLVVWDRATGEEKAAVLAHKESVDAVVFSPDGSVLYSGGADCLLRAWQLAPSYEKQK